MKLIHWKKEKARDREKRREKQRHKKSQREEDVRERPQPHWAVSLVEAGCEGLYDCGERLVAEAVMVWVLYRCSGCSV